MVLQELLPESDLKATTCFGQVGCVLRPKGRFHDSHDSWFQRKSVSGSGHFEGTIAHPMEG